MKRRQFIQKGALTGSLFTLGGAAIGAELFSSSFEETQWETAHRYNLKYAPHEGMFKTHAGDAIIDQLEFMADQGFTAFEDNEMRNRTVAVQNEMAKVMEKS